MTISIQDALNAYAARGRLSFHTPGHKGREDFLEGLYLSQSDVTELPELDTLAAPTGILLEAQRRAAEAYGAEETFFLVNGATAGNLAMMLAVRGEDGGTPEKIVCVDRCAHRSVGAALTLSGLVPRYAVPVVHPDFLLPLGADPGEYWREREKILAVHVTCPCYFGASLDAGRLLSMRDDLAQGIPVLVDQAHGAHWRGELFPPNAVVLGADAVVHSAHKTLASLTQSALLHVQGHRLNKGLLAQALEMVQSSSPSYLLMASLDAAVGRGECAERWSDLLAEAQRLRHDLGGVYRILGDSDVGTYGIAALDGTKILLNTVPLGIEAGVVAEALRGEFGIEPELWDDRNILFVLGVGSYPEDVQALRQALGSLAERRSWRKGKAGTGKPGTEKTGGGKPGQETTVQGMSLHVHVPPMRLSPREAWLAPRRAVALKDSLGEVAAETIVAYPPGIPLVVAGEEITEEVMHNVFFHPQLRDLSSIAVVNI